jgi:alkylresorcinol/alkylpyrone synthase
MGFRTDAARIPVFGLGCAGGVTGLAIAAKLAEARPGTTVLLVAVELCSLAIRLDKFTKANVVATALFGDGAAACVLRAGEGGIAAVEASGEHRWPDTLGMMGWAVETDGFGVIFDREIPPFTRQHMGAAVTDLLERHGLGLADVGRFVCHPGGAKVVEALEEALALPSGKLDHERAVLADYGNMPAPTVFFVLERVLAGQLPERACLLSLVPGFTASCVVLRKR